MQRRLRAELGGNVSRRWAGFSMMKDPGSNWHPLQRRPIQLDNVLKHGFVRLSFSRKRKTSRKLWDARATAQVSKAKAASSPLPDFRLDSYRWAPYLVGCRGKGEEKPRRDDLCTGRKARTGDRSVRLTSQGSLLRDDQKRAIITPIRPSVQLKWSPLPCNNLVQEAATLIQRCDLFSVLQ